MWSALNYFRLTASFRPIPLREYKLYVAVSRRQNLSERLLLTPSRGVTSPFPLSIVATFFMQKILQNYHLSQITKQIVFKLTFTNPLHHIHLYSIIELHSRHCKY